MSALAKRGKGKAWHVPYRDSKLTHVLADSLGGDSKTLMFVCCSPSPSDVPETQCSLDFASRVRNVELGPATKQTGGTGWDNGRPFSYLAAPPPVFIGL